MGRSGRGSPCQDSRGLRLSAPGSTITSSGSWAGSRSYWRIRDMPSGRADDRPALSRGVPMRKSGLPSPFMSPRAATLEPTSCDATLPVSRTPRPGSVVWVPWTCGLNPDESAMNGSCPPGLGSSRRSGRNTCDILRCAGTQLQQCQENLRFQCLATWPKRLALALLCARRPGTAIANQHRRLPSPKLDSACATRDCGSTRSRRVFLGRPV